MILSVLVINNSGKPRLSKFFSPECTATHVRTQLVSKIYSAIQDRPDALCNFVDLPASDGLSQPARIVYRHYATLYFIFLVDEAESELGILDLIQVFVESLDRCFENVCELDLIFHFDEVHTLLSCIVVGGMVMDTSIDSIAQSFKAQMKLRKQSINQDNLGSSLSSTSLASFQGTSGWDRLSKLRTFGQSN